MSEPKLILSVELLEGNKVRVTFGTKHPAILALALQQADLQFKELLLDKLVPEQKSIIEPSGIQVPKDLISQL